MEINLTKSPLQAVLLVSITVVMGLVAAWVLKSAALEGSISMTTLFWIVLSVAVLNASRFLIWGYLHKHYPLSFSYPLNSLFFPAILIMGYYFGESLGITQVLGVMLITMGIAILLYERKG